MFLYECLYASLPGQLSVFMADISEMFPNGVYDSKVIAEFHARDSSSFLEYLFRKAQRAIARATRSWLSAPSSSTHQGASLQQDLPSQSQPHQSQLKSRQLTISHPNYSMLPASCVNYVPLPSAPSEIEGSDDHCRVIICEEFAGHGHCKRGKGCERSHNLDAILAHEESQQTRRRRKRHNGKKSDSNTDAKLDATSPPLAIEISAPPVPTEASKTPVVSSDQSLSTSRSQGHRAGFDAFMTGYLFAYYQTTLPEAELQSAKNKLFVTSKPFPMHVAKSQYTNTSESHRQKQSRLAPQGR